MHPSVPALIAYCDAETSASRTRAIAAHLANCEKCRGQLRLIESEKDELSAHPAAPPLNSEPGLAELQSAIAAWQSGESTAAASELKRRLRTQLETYFGMPAVALVDRPGLRAEDLLGSTHQVLDAFLGPDAAEAVRDDVLRGLDWARPARETYR